MFEKFQKSAKVAVILSQEEAREMDDTRIGAEHVLVGVLDSAGAPLSELMGGYGLTADGVRDRLRAGSEQPPMDEEDAEALRAIGIDLSQVRESVSKVFGPQAFDKAFEKSGRRKARVRGWRPFGMIPFNSSAKSAWSWLCGRPSPTKTIGSDASTWCWASCAAATRSPWPSSPSGYPPTNCATQWSVSSIKPPSSTRQGPRR